MFLHDKWQKMSCELDKVIVEAWGNPEFAEKLKADPKGTILGFTNKVFFADDVEVKIDTSATSWRTVQAPDEPTKAVIFIPLPPKPANVTIEELRQLVTNDCETFAQRYQLACC